MNHKKLIKVGIVPTIRQVYSDQFEYSFDLKLYDLLNRVFKNYNLVLLNKKSNLKNIGLVIFLGGNDLTLFSKKKHNKIRSEIDLKILKKCLKQNISILGICHGMQMIANFFKSRIIKKRQIGDHMITYFEKGKFIKKKVNSYHNYVISYLGKEFQSIAWANDDTCEAMIHKKRKILGLMWHPERYKKIKKFDVYLIKKFLCN